MPLPVSMDATWLDGSVQFNGQELRRADSGLWVGEGSTPFGVLGGITRHSDTSLAVTVNASDLITIQPGACAIPGNAGVGNGVYRTALGAAETGQLAARNATNPRIDRVIYRVLDTSVVGSHAAYTGRIEVLTGTPAASPVVPALPTLAIELARVTVPATGGGVATVDSSWRTYAAAIGGTLPVATAARLPATPNAKYLRAVAVDTGRHYEWSGTAWVIQDYGQSEDLLPGQGGFTFTAGVISTGEGVTIHKRGGMVSFPFYLRNTNGVAAGTLMTIPAGWRPSRSVRGVANITSAAVVRTMLGQDGLFNVEGGLAANEILYGSMSWAVA